MEIKSNTAGKIKKILNGTVFGDQYTFIKEFLQNAQRSKAKNICFDTDKDDACLIINDDGCGCKNPENVFTLDLSEWESTNEGFGIGFWSCLCMPGIKKITVESQGWMCSVNVDDLKDGILKVEKGTSDIKEGFCTTLFSTPEAILGIESILWNKLSETAQFLKMNVLSNGKMVERKNILDTITLEKDNLYVEEFHNSFFDAKLATSSYNYASIRFYYEDRFVMETTENFYSTGIVNIKPGKVTLKEPDREEFVRDLKFYNLFKTLKKCCEKMFKNALEEYGDDNNIARGAAYFLSERELLKHLNFNGFDMDGIRSEMEKELSFEIPVPEKTEKQQEDIEQKRQQMVAAKIESADIVEEQHKEEDQHIHQKFVSRPVIIDKKKANKDFVSKLSRIKMAVWVETDSTGYYQDDIAKANYCGVNVFEAKNPMYSKVLADIMPHIRDLSSILSECFSKEDIELKTQKEKAFIQWLTPIVEHFNLPNDVFMIANLSHEIIFENGGKSYRTVRKNTADKVLIKGITDGHKIYLDRHMLSLKKQKLNVTGYMGGNEMRALMKALPTIAHELAHYLYQTVDNTTKHFAAIEKLMEEIALLY